MYDSTTHSTEEPACTNAPNADNVHLLFTDTKTVQSTCSSNKSESLMMDPFRIYHDEVVQEMQRIQTKMFPGKIFPRISDVQMDQMLREKWNQLTESEREPFVEQAKHQASLLLPACIDTEADTAKEYLTIQSSQLRRRQSELAPGEAPSVDILPTTYPANLCNQNFDHVLKAMSARILFSRHLREILKKGYPNLDYSVVNYVIAQCWHRLTFDQKKIYEILIKQKCYYVDVRGAREHSIKEQKVNIPQSIDEHKLRKRAEKAQGKGRGRKPRAYYIQQEIEERQMFQSTLSDPE